MAHSCFVAALYTGLFLALVPLGKGASNLAALPNCGFVTRENGSLALLLSCPRPHKLSIPARVRTQHGITLTLVNTNLRLDNVTTVSIELPSLPPSSILKQPVEIKHCGLSGLQQLPQVASAQNLLLNLSDLGLHLGDQDGFAGIGRVTWLDLSNNQIVEVPSDSFNSLPELLVLDLSSNMIDFLSNDSFCGLSMLRVLDIRDNPMLMTFALVQLPSLEFLDTSMSVLEAGVFCRLNSLKRVVLHRPVDRLQCFVFDSLSSLMELSFLYFSGTNQLCFTMMCDPHPVLKQRVPFNFTISRLSNDGSIAKVSTNFFLTRFTSLLNYERVCTKNYRNYYQHHDNGFPITTGCLQLEGISPRCPPRHQPTSLCGFQALSSAAAPMPSNRSSTPRSPPAAGESTVRAATSSSQDTSTQQSRLAELEAVTLRQARLLIALYVAIGLLVLCAMVLAGRHLLKQFSKRRRLLAMRHEQQQSLVSPLKALAGTEALQANGKEGLKH